MQQSARRVVAERVHELLPLLKGTVRNETHLHDIPLSRFSHPHVMAFFVLSVLKKFVAEGHC